MSKERRSREAEQLNCRKLENGEHIRKGQRKRTVTGRKGKGKTISVTANANKVRAGRERKEALEKI